MKNVQILISRFEKIHEEKYYFLGPWCFGNNHQKYKENKHLLINEDYSKDDIEKYYKIYQNLFEKILYSLSDFLNKYHNINNKNIYWRILLGPWLETYLTTYLDRYRNILNLKKKFPNSLVYLINNEILKKNIFKIEDSQHFTQMIGNNYDFNYFIHSEIANEILSHKNLKENNDSKFFFKKFKYMRFLETKLMRYFKLFYNFFIIKIISLFSNKIILYNQNYVRSLESIKFSYLTKRFFLQFYVVNDIFNTKKIDKIRNIKLDIDDDSEIANILSKHIMKYVPICYIEEYNKLIINSHKYYPFKISNYFTLTAMMYSESLKHKIAISKKNIRLIMGQHGGPVNITVGHPQTDHELSICDYYISWGWKKKNFEDKCVPITSSFFFNKKYKTKKNKTSILWLTNSHPHHIKYLNNFTLNFNDYLISQKNFYRSLNTNIKKFIKIRFSYDIHNWSLRDFYSSFIPKDNFDSMNIAFSESASVSKLSICDLPGTTFAELLAMNMPVVAFWNPTWFAYTNDSEKIFKCLKKAKILFDSHIDAANHINRVYFNLDEWWYSESTQEAIKLYSKNYAYRSENYIEEWKKFINKF